jgi:glycosyltransferase involved in cell wall biosynthesis
VPAAIAAMIEETPDALHVVLFVRHRGALGEADRHPSATYIDAGPSLGIVPALRLVADTYRDLRPDVVHAHSSYAGVYVRTLPAIPRARVVYSPHCFAFERRDVGRGGRTAFRLAEKVLSLRTRCVVALSEREAELARSLRHGLDVAEARNVPGVPAARWGTAVAPEGGPLVVAASGRLCAQKDPSFFAEVVRLAAADGLSARWIWIGDGDPGLRDELDRAGVEVTGWHDRAGVLAALSASHVFLHTAAWETGVPIAVLEAAALGLPVVARSIPAIEGTSFGRLIRTPAEGAAELRPLADPSAWNERSETTQASLRALLREQSLRAALEHAYRLPPARDTVDARPDGEQRVPSVA